MNTINRIEVALEECWAEWVSSPGPATAFDVVEYAARLDEQVKGHRSVRALFARNPEERMSLARMACAHCDAAHSLEALSEVAGETGARAQHEVAEGKRWRQDMNNALSMIDRLTGDISTTDYYLRLRENVAYEVRRLGDRLDAAPGTMALPAVLPIAQEALLLAVIAGTACRGCAPHLLAAAADNDAWSIELGPGGATLRVESGDETTVLTVTQDKHARAATWLVLRVNDAEVLRRRFDDCGRVSLRGSVTLPGPGGQLPASIRVQGHVLSDDGVLLGVF